MQTAMFAVAEPLKKCSKCRIIKPIPQFPRAKGRRDGFYPYCKPCKSSDTRRYLQQPGAAERAKERHRRWKKDNPEKVRSDSRKRMLAQYGLSASEYETMFELQHGACAICHRPETDRNRSGTTKLLAVDHDHATMRIRGLLCRKCNTVIGLMDEDTGRLAEMISYLIQHRGH